MVSVLSTRWGSAKRTPKVPDVASRSRTPANAQLFVGTCALILLLAEPLLRLRYAEPRRTATPEILAIQRHLQLHPAIGFTWNANVAPEQNIVLKVSDVEFRPLSTDKFGFMNHPDAIARQAAGEAVDIIGLGDSFIEHASHNFYEFFNSHGLTYYGMAVHRQAPPQYNVILQQNALPLRPKWVLYGLFENDFMETADFDHWRSSGLDWFTFHSGTWCGPPVATNALARFKDRYLMGYGGLYRVLHARVRGEKMTVSGPGQAEILRVVEELRRARDLASARGAAFALLLIPSRATALEGPTLESRAYDALLNELDDESMTVVDLRTPFVEHEDPASLFYTIDAHWNGKGMDLAAAKILDALRQADARVPPKNPRAEAVGH